MLLEMVLIGLAGALAFTFCVLYTRYANWWRNPQGRHLFTLTAGIGGFAVVSLLARTVGTDWPGYDVLVMTLYAVMVYQLWRRIQLLWIANHPQRDREASK